MALKRKTKAVEEDVPQLNEAETEALSSQTAEDEKSREISMKKMEQIVALVSDRFNLSDGNYVVTAFSDKGNKSQISLANDGFEITVLVKDNEAFGIM
jgi:hypothetical protein